jgi:hypothetical protein
MGKLIPRCTIVFLVLVLIASVFGVQTYSNARTTNMPAEIRYEIVLSDNVWPDRYYSVTYDMPEPRSLSFNGYWTFEPGKHPFPGPVWIYHTNELILKETNYTVNQIAR